MNQLPIILALGTTQTLAWASSYYLPAILADPIARFAGRAKRIFDRQVGDALARVEHERGVGGDVRGHVRERERGHEEKGNGALQRHG